MSFETDKKNVLGRMDKSKKGELDDGIKEICSLINENSNYYTTSSCSGRIVVLEKKSEKKDEARWIFVSHEETDFEPIKQSIGNTIKTNLNPETTAWFKQEGAILHVCCRTISDAERFLNIARDSGFKRAGIISAGENPVVEIISSEQMNLPIIAGGKIIVADEYLKILISEANRKMQRNREKLRKLEDNIRRLY